MNAPLPIILAETKARLHALCGDRLQRIVLFGSRARGDAAPDSDIDLLLVMENRQAIAELKESILDIVASISLHYDTVVSCLYCLPGAIESGRLPLYHNVRQEGIAV